MDKKQQKTKKLRKFGCSYSLVNIFNEQGYGTADNIELDHFPAIYELIEIVWSGSLQHHSVKKESIVILNVWEIK